MRINVNLVVNGLWQICMATNQRTSVAHYSCWTVLTALVLKASLRCCQGVNPHTNQLHIVRRHKRHCIVYLNVLYMRGSLWLILSDHPTRLVICMVTTTTILNKCFGSVTLSASQRPKAS